jgi:cardiolipin synthase
MNKNYLITFRSQLFSYLPSAEKRITLATVFTLLRIALIPVVVGAMIVGSWGLALVTFVIACLTDVIDGYVARLLNEQTFLGACLDPIADKLLVVSCFITLAFVATPFSLISPLFVLLIISKEIMQIVGAFIIYFVQRYVVIQPTLLGKASTCIQMIFIIFLCACYFFCYKPTNSYCVMMMVVTCFIISSFVQYVCIGMRALMNKG